MNMNKKLISSAVAASIMTLSGVQAVNAEIELGTGLSVSGFVDMSYLYTDVDGAASTDKVFAVDQVETDFMYTGSNGVSAQVDIEYSDGAALVEQAFITKKLGDSFSVKAGRFLSYSGWEAEEPTGLYQYSGTGYAPAFYGYYQQGVSAYYDGGMVDLMVSVVNSAFNPLENDTQTLATEFGVALQPVEGLTAKLFYTTDEDDTRVNFWTSYEFSSVTLAFEYNVADYADKSAADGFLFMANYAIGSWGFTARLHDWSTENAAGVTTFENSAITIAPSYAVGDNLLLVAEYRMDDIDGTDVNSFALEALFTF